VRGLGIIWLENKKSSVSEKLLTFFVPRV